MIEALENAGSQAERAGEILRRLRRYSRRGEHQPVVCSLNEIVQNAVRLLVPRTRELGVTVQLELCTEEVRRRLAMATGGNCCCRCIGGHSSAAMSSGGGCGGETPSANSR